MSPEAQVAARTKAESLQTSINLQALRKKLHVTQANLAQAMMVQQAAISKMENREDLLISSVMDFVRGLGGTLVLTAVFPDDKKFDLTPEAPKGIGRVVVNAEAVAPQRRAGRETPPRIKRALAKSSA